MLQVALHTSDSDSTFLALLFEITVFLSNDSTFTDGNILKFFSSFDVELENTALVSANDATKENTIII